MPQPVHVVVTMSTFGQWLAVQRRLQGISQAVIADLLKVSKQTISYWENNHHDAVITTQQYKCLLQALGTEPGQEPQTGLIVRRHGQNRQQAMRRTPKSS